MPPLRYQSADLLPPAAPLRARDLSTLESRSRRPRKIGQPGWRADAGSAGAEAGGAEVAPPVSPRWGKDKLAVLVQGGGHAVSVSMVGRILARLRRRVLLVEPLRNHLGAPSSAAAALRGAQAARLCARAPAECARRGLRLFALPRARPSSTTRSSVPGARIPRSSMNNARWQLDGRGHTKCHPCTEGAQ